MSEKKLVIVESPAKAKTINKYLGDEYIVESSKGHLIDLPKSRLGVDVNNNFKPEYKVIKGKNEILKKLKELAKQVSGILLAADPDREGEAISWHISNALKSINSNIKRIIFHEITKDAIKEAVKNPTDIDMNKVNAQQARRILDRLVGYNLSPFLWKKVKAGLSAGRVQSVALKLICERENEISSFKPEEYWTIDVLFQKDNKKFSARLVKINDEKPVIRNKEEAERIKNMLSESDFIVEEIAEQERKKNPPPPYITSKLQQDGLNRLGFSAKKTMMIAQALYEGIDIKGEGPVGLITYMRTDSVRIADVALNQVRNFIASNFGPDYLPETPNVYKSKETAQEAHEAIRPTSVERTPDKIKDSLDKDQFKLYSLIFNRFVASQMKPAILLLHTIKIKAKHKSNTEFTLQLSSSKYKFDGFTKVYPTGKEEKIETPDLKLNENLNLKEVIAEQHFTQPPPRYTDASLVKILEELGIGRPSTYAPTIATLEERHYIEREGRQLIPTQLGMIVNELLTKNFKDLINEKFTAKMEEDLDKIATAKLDWIQMLKDFYPKLMNDVQNALKNIDVIADYKFGEKTNEICDKCGAPMVKKLGRFGYFLACSNFPKCKNAKPLPIADCPVSGCNGKIVLRRTKRGRKFYACSNFPNCTFTLWEKPLNEKCPKCSYPLVYSKQNKKLIKKCSNPQCDFFIPVEEEQQDEQSED
jgi:DNA topoisomerase-1